jgi:hypothetical protein
LGGALIGRLCYRRRGKCRSDHECLRQANTRKNGDPPRSW